MKSNSGIIREIIKADYRFMGNISAKLKELLKAGRLTESLPLETAVNLMYG